MLLFNLLRFRLRLIHNSIGNRISNAADNLIILAGIGSIAGIVTQIGFLLNEDTIAKLVAANAYMLAAICLLLIIKLIPDSTGKKTTFKEVIYTAAIAAYCLIIFRYQSIDNTLTQILRNQYTIATTLFLISVYEISRIGILFLSRKVSPTILFVGSFFIIIIIGAGLLMLPRSQSIPMSFVDTFFTSTSAVCVTGLTVVDTATHFSTFGQCIILLLIQIGGIGVMTFTSFFALSLNGKSSLKNRIVIKDLVSADNMNDIFQTLKRIIYVTIIIEVTAAWLIYQELLEIDCNMDIEKRLFCAVFHSISSFCNAGFTTLPNGFANDIFKGNYYIYAVVTLTIFVGGIGFPLQSNIINWVKYKFKKLYYRLRHRQDKLVFRSHLVNISSRLILYTHVSLLVFGLLFFFFSERGATQAGDSVVGRMFESLFLSITARSAGFNSVDISALNPMTIVIMVVLMWIGCAPMSTGGGIKTSTFAVAILNMVSVVRKSKRIEVYNRQISQDSIQKSYAIITLTILTVLVGTLLTKTLDPQFSLKQHLFENISATSTAGLTLGLTPELCTTSKAIIILEMFVGRIGILGFLSCFIETKSHGAYEYPHDTVTL